MGTTAQAPGHVKMSKRFIEWNTENTLNMPYDNNQKDQIFTNNYTLNAIKQECIFDGWIQSVSLSHGDTSKCTRWKVDTLYWARVLPEFEGKVALSQYFGHPMWRADSLEKTLVPGKVEGKRRRGWQSMRWLDKHHQLNAHVLGATTGDPTHDKGHAERTWQAKAERDSEGFPGSARASTPKLKSVCLLFIILCFSPTLLTFTGGYPQPPFSEENQLRALVTKSPGLERSIFTLTHLLLF